MWSQVMQKNMLPPAQWQKQSTFFYYGLLFTFMLWNINYVKHVFALITLSGFLSFIMWWFHLVFM